MAGVSYPRAKYTSWKKKILPQYFKILKSGYFTVEDKGGRKNKIKLNFYKDLFKYNTLDSIKKISVPTLIIHGAEDEIVSLKHSKKAFSLLKNPKKLIIIPGMNHLWQQPKYYKKVNSAVVYWLKKYLK